MKRRHNCKCPCHQGGVAIHVVPCCDGMPLGLLIKSKHLQNKTERPKKTHSKVSSKD
jgi:hypothetical protein